MRIQSYWHYWYGLRARLIAIQHWLRGHDLHWNDRRHDEYRELGVLLWSCRGDIVCLNCPDIEPEDEAAEHEDRVLVLWCRGIDE